jgi:chitinase
MPEDIPFNNLNTINYGFVDFATPKSYPWMGKGKYNIVTADGGADYRQLVALWKEKQRKPYLKVVLSFGGWTNDNETIYPDINFEQMTDAQQQAFAKEAALLVKSMGFDGVDIDWEWWANHRFGKDACFSSIKPGAPYCQSGMVNHDTKKYVNLLKYLRQELGSDKLLTVATVSSATKIKSEEDPALGGYVGAWKDIAKYVDYINIMAYDMHGAFDTTTASQAPWDIDAQHDPFHGKPGGVTIKSSIQAYIDSGVPVGKLVLGMPAYGRSSIISSEGTTGGLYQASSGAPKGEFDATGVYTYKCLTQGDCHGGGTKPALTLHTKGTSLFNTYGGYALTPWGSSSNMFMTYDDQNSVKAKLQETCSAFGQLGGGMVWALDGDTKDSTSIVTAVMNNINCK